MVDLISLTSVSTLMPQVIQWIIDPKTAMGGGMLIVVLVLVYLIFPSFREALGAWLKKQEKEKDEEYSRDKNFSSWLMKRTDQLEEERERRMIRVETENMQLKDRLVKLEKEIRIQVVYHEETQQRLRNLEWIFLGEICDALIERVNRQKEDMASRLSEVGKEEMAQAVKREFEKLVESVRESFLVRSMERTRQFIEEKNMLDGKEGSAFSDSSLFLKEHKSSTDSSAFFKDS